MSLTASDIGRRYIAAFHEAGHCVAVIALGGGVGVLHLDDYRGDGFFSGRIPMPNSLGLELGDANAVALLAGRAAELRLGRSRQASHHDAMREAADSGAASDTDNALRHVDGSASRFRAASETARRLIEKHWGAVTSLAAELYDRGKLTAVEIVEAVKEAEDPNLHIKCVG